MAINELEAVFKYTPELTILVPFMIGLIKVTLNNNQYKIIYRNHNKHSVTSQVATIVDYDARRLDIYANNGRPTYYFLIAIDRQGLVNESGERIKETHAQIVFADESKIEIGEQDATYEHEFERDIGLTIEYTPGPKGRRKYKTVQE